MDNDNYYYFDVQNSLGKPRLYVQLLDESGGAMIYFDKQ